MIRRVSNVCRPSVDSLSLYFNLGKQALVNRFWTLSILLMSILKQGLHTVDKNSRTGRTKTENALLNSLGSRETKHLSISVSQFGP